MVAALHPFIERWSPRLSMMAGVRSIQLAPTLGAQKGLHAIRPWMLDELVPDAVALAKALDAATETTWQADRERQERFDAPDPE